MSARRASICESTSFEVLDVVELELLVLEVPWATQLMAAASKSIGTRRDFMCLSLVIFNVKWRMASFERVRTEECARKNAHLLAKIFFSTLETMN
jgi:hypothetical protein